MKRDTNMAMEIPEMTDGKAARPRFFTLEMFTFTITVLAGPVSYTHLTLPTN